MTVCKSDYELYSNLQHNFLYKKDINSIHMLLNLYDLEDNIRNIYPKYISIKHLRNRIKRCLRNKRGKELIAKNLSDLIHEDINRLELSLYLDGYKEGYYDKRRINILENLTIRYYLINDLYNLKYLFHFEDKKNDILDYKYNIFNQMDKDEDLYNYLYKNINNYVANIIKNKVFHLNKYLDKQLTIDYNSDIANIKEDGSLLTKNDLSSIYREVKKVIIRNGLKLYKDAYWNGLNDGVLKRYR